MPDCSELRRCGGLVRALWPCRVHSTATAAVVRMHSAYTGTRVCPHMRHSSRPPVSPVFEDNIRVRCWLVAGVFAAELTADNPC
jgi:hypothetical protein